jgi:hypothetical protein
MNRSRGRQEFVAPVDNQTSAVLTQVCVEAVLRVCNVR